MLRKAAASRKAEAEVKVERRSDFHQLILNLNLLITPADFFGILLVLDRSLEFFLDTGHLALQTPCTAFPIINLDRAGNVDQLELRWSARVAQQENTFAGCSKCSSSKAAASGAG